jgi:predicted nucleic-acid-binding protein
MIALDTDVLVRCLTLDDPSQVPAAKALLAHRHGVYVAKTVLLELEWVLRAAYKLKRPTIHSALIKLLGLPNLTAESPSQVGQALDGYSRGLDFADALHLFASPADEGLFTFDEQFASVATAAGHSVHLAAVSPGRAGR